MVRRITVYTFTAAIIIAFTLGVSLAAEHGSSMYKDESMSGHAKNGMDQVEVDLKSAPKVSSSAKGESDFKYNEKNNTLSYDLKVNDIKDVTAAHIHMVKPDGTPGEVIAPLYPAAGTGALPSGGEMHADKGKAMKEGEFSGTLSKGNITDAQLIGPMKGKTTEDVYDLLRSGKAGVNVHTKEHPNGEIWGTAKTSKASDMNMK